MHGTQLSSRERSALIAFQAYLERTYPLTSYHVADISDYVRVRLLQPRTSREPRKISTGKSDGCKSIKVLLTG